MAASAEDILKNHTPVVVELMQQLRHLVVSSMPDATERIYLGWHGIGFHHPTAGYVCGLFPGADKVRVGFEHGHLLSDPHGLFDSGGSQVRYVTVKRLTPELTRRLGELVEHAICLRAH